jgi:hypothetical protein
VVLGKRSGGSAISFQGESTAKIIPGPLRISTGQWREIRTTRKVIHHQGLKSTLGKSNVALEFPGVLLCPWWLKDLSPGLGFRFRKIFDGKPLPVALSSRDPNGIHVTVEQVGAMMRRLDPFGVNDLRAWTLGHILG